MLRHVINGIPLFLALVALLSCSHRLLVERRSQRKILLALGIGGASLMLVAQSSWWYTVFSGLTEGEVWANMVWTVFNGLAMVVFIMMSRPRGSKP